MSWRRIPTRFLIREVDRRGGDQAPSLPLLSVSEYRGVIPRSESPSGQEASEDVSIYKRCQPGQLVLNKLWAFRAGLGVSNTAGLVSPAYSVYDFTEAVHPRYMHYQMRSAWYVAEMTARLKGIGTPGGSAGRTPHLNTRDLGEILSYVPPLREQRAIADFLDTETARIDALITRKQQLIGSLREFRAGLIAAAVEQAPSTTSGARLRHFVSTVVQGWSPQCASTPADGVTDWGVLKAGAANGGVFRPHENKALPPDETPRPELVVRPGQLIISRANTRELVGSAAVVEHQYPRLMLCDKLYALHLDEAHALPQYVSLVLGTRRLRDLIEIEASGSSPSMQNISRDDILNLPIDLPPLEDQVRIVEEVRGRSSQIDRLVSKTEASIELLREHRQALITAAVTGELEAPGAAA